LGKGPNLSPTPELRWRNIKLPVWFHAYHPTRTTPIATRNSLWSLSRNNNRFVFQDTKTSIMIWRTKDGPGYEILKRTARLCFRILV
jgi:hypothetical protein